MKNKSQCGCGRTRRSFLADTGMGFTGLALSAMLFRDGASKVFGVEEPAWRPPDGRPHFTPRAKAVIWIFLCGGVSHVESFDVKPELNKYAGKSIQDTPYKDALDPAKVNKNIIGANPAHGNRKVIMPLQTGYKAYGESGLVVGDWFKHIGECADDLAIVRSLWTIHNDHGAQLTWQTGRHPRELDHPTIGSWVCYGLGTVNQNLPEYVVLGLPTGDCCGGAFTHGAAYLGAEYAGVRLNVDPKNPMPFIAPPEGSITREEQLENLSLLGKLNHLAGIDYPDDKDLRARIKAYELAFQMQTSIPETLELEREPEATRRLYGIDQSETKQFGEQCLVARRLVERGVRFVQLFHGGGGGGDWDAHSEIKSNHGKLAQQVDKPIAGLLQDLKQRGMLDDTIVVFGTEFGRSPGAEGTGRDHHPQGFSAWLAGGGIKGGIGHGVTDELGFHAVEDRHYVTDIHATVLKLLGLDSHRLEIPGRKRLDMDHGEAIHQIIG
ncbi:MAG TPA: DUF1501 domain-containing protein [Verrucomicrobiae bacterium]|jgi:hypothetical protein|nr:DUF1501 domain-containing protein [Verrucomicrobiae bacterium]